MKLSKWASQQGLSYKTAYRLFCNDQLPVPSSQLPTGTILVHVEPGSSVPKQAALYCRVSSHDQKEDLQRQLGRLRDFAASRGLSIQKEVTEIASGLNSKRRKLTRLLADPTVSPIIVEHRDRLARFGVNFIEAAMQAGRRELLVMNQSECKDDLVQDFVDLTTSMCARIYGRRSAANRAKRALAAAKK